jgi:hypothetical protein
MADKEDALGSRVGAAASASEEGEGEFKAMHAIVTVLKPLTEEERRRVLEYVLGRFGALPIDAVLSSRRTGAVGPQGGGNAPAAVASSEAIRDIRSLKEAKSPKSAIEMATLVAFYVSEAAPLEERKDTITRADLQRYFKNAGFKLPADAGFTLVNAKNAGYLDNAGSGQYRLNPVGYNLVAHRMGITEEKGSQRHRTKKIKRTTRKSPNSRSKR